jgi:hypothetical protein
MKWSVDCISKRSVLKRTLMKLTASDRSAMIRLASSLPKGSDERRAILAGLKKTASGSLGDYLQEWLKEIGKALGGQTETDAFSMKPGVYGAFEAGAVVKGIRLDFSKGIAEFMWTIEDDEGSQPLIGISQLMRMSPRKVAGAVERAFAGLPQVR